MGVGSREQHLHGMKREEGHRRLTFGGLVLHVSEVDDPHALLVLVEGEVESQATNDATAKARARVQVREDRLLCTSGHVVCDGTAHTLSGACSEWKQTMRASLSDASVLSL